MKAHTGHVRNCLSLRSAAGAEGKAPTEIVIIPAGVTRTSLEDEATGKLIAFGLDPADAPGIIQAFRDNGNDVVIDYEHATDQAGERHDGTAPAAGWIKRLAFDPQRGIVAAVDWNPKGRALIENREYRYFSPTVYTYTREDGTRWACGLRNAALTNQPAIQGALPLAAKHSLLPMRKAIGVDPRLITSRGIGRVVTARNRDALAAVLGMKDASLEDLRAVVLALRDIDGVRADPDADVFDFLGALLDVDLGESSPTIAADIDAAVTAGVVGELRKLLGLDASAGRGEVVAALLGMLGIDTPHEESWRLKDGATMADGMAELRARLDDLESRIAALEGGGADRKGGDETVAAKGRHAYLRKIDELMLKSRADARMGVLRDPSSGMLRSEPFDRLEATGLVQQQHPALFREYLNTKQKVRIDDDE